MTHNSNGEIPPTGDPRVDAALVRIRGKFRDLEDAVLVQVHLEKRLDEQGREHANWLRDHQKALEAHQEWLKRHQRALEAHQEWFEQFERALQADQQRFDRHTLVLCEIEDKLNGLTDIVDRKQRGESR